MGLRPHKPSDYPSFLLYVLDETHLTVTALTASYILYNRSAHSVYFASGALASSLTAKLIKKFIKSPRPPPPPPSTPEVKRQTHIRPKKTYGMPSTHSTALTFYFAYLVPVFLSSLFPSAPNPAHPSHYGTSFSFWTRNMLDGWSTASKVVALGGITAYWVGGIWSRVELGYHTYPQCYGGIGLGTLLAIAWRVMWEKNGWLGDGLQRLIDVVWAESVGRLL